jgi:SET domain-containing protein
MFFKKLIKLYNYLLKNKKFMLQIKTYLDKSPIHGIGVFADEDIKKDQLIWKFDKQTDIALGDKESINCNIEEIQKQYPNYYIYFDLQFQQLIFLGDNDRFTNHSDNPNTENDINGDVFALKEIKKGEELTLNYYDIDSFAKYRLEKI